MAKTHSGKATVTLPTDEQILIRREFAVPKHLVYQAWTTPELVKRWWAGQRGVLRIADIDLRVGGMWRYVMDTHGGFEVAFHGTYQEIVPNERIVTTQIFEGAPAEHASDVPLNIITFSESSGKTQLEFLVQCPHRALRDIIISTGMEVGMQEQMDLLEALAQSL